MGLGWPQEQGQLDFRVDLDAITMMWPWSADEDGVIQCDGYLEPVPDRRYKSGLRPVMCRAYLSFGTNLTDAYEAIDDHRKEVKHYGD